MNSIGERLKQIRLIVSDIDGVLTDGKIRLTDDGKEIKAFCAKDSPPVRLALANGIKIAFVTGRKSAAAEMRAKQFGINLYYKSDFKDTSLVEHLEQSEGVMRGNTLYIGDDLNDLAIMRQIGIPACPADAVPEVLEICEIKTKAEGGDGVLAEIIRLVMHEQGTWKEAVASLEREQFSLKN